MNEKDKSFIEEILNNGIKMEKERLVFEHIEKTLETLKLAATHIRTFEHGIDTLKKSVKYIFNEDVEVSKTQIEKRCKFVISCMNKKIAEIMIKTGIEPRFEDDEIKEKFDDLIDSIMKARGGK